jgi:aminoglycoside/choline kinase family phosphotransferase
LTDSTAYPAEAISESCQAFLGRRPIRIDEIPAGLGTRRFFRVSIGDVADGVAPDAGASRGSGPPPRVLIARVEPRADPGNPGSDDSHPSRWLPEPPLEPLRSFLEDAGLPVPRSFGHDPARGIDLIEDVGDRTLLDLRGAERDAGYRESLRLIAHLQALEEPSDAAVRIPAFERCFDRALLRTKAWKLRHWGFPGILGRMPTETESRAIEDGFGIIADALDDSPRVLSHRDFKAENLHVVSDAGAPVRLVMIDVQGAFRAPPEYDLVCLLRDLQVELPEAFVEGLRQEAFARWASTRDPEMSVRRFDMLTLVRLAKDVSHLVDAALNRGDRRRWHEVPRGLELLGGAARRLQTTFPEIRALNNVIETLTRDGAPTDIQGSLSSRSVQES